jgi:DNA-binding NarL/FixJ family response regulator
MNILVICRHVDILETIIRLLRNEEGWSAQGVATDQDAIKKFQTEDFDIVMIGSGVDAESEKELITKFKKQKPEIKIVRHYGGGSGLLYSEIMEAIKK